MSSGTPASVTTSNAEAERSQLSPQSQGQMSPQLPKVSEEKSTERSQNVKDTPDSTVQGEVGRESNSQDGSLGVMGKPRTKQKEEGNSNANDTQKKKQEENKEKSISSKEDDGYAPNVFYAYARRVSLLGFYYYTLLWRHPPNN